MKPISYTRIHMGHHLGFAAAVAIWLFSPAYAQEVYKCGNVYTDSPCADAKIVDTSPAVTDPAGPKTRLIYLCQGREKNGLWWLDRPCSHRSWTVVDSVRVPIDADWEDQVRWAQAKRAAQATPNRAATGNSIAAAPQNNQRACEALDRQVEQLDAAGRAGSRYHSLERLREQRKSARDEQFRLGC